VIDRRRTAEDFTNAVEAAVGGSLIGAVLFGSVARRTDTEHSDVDLLFALTDVNRDAAAEQISTLARQVAGSDKVAASSESYSRLRYFADLGDPFVRTIIGEGEILRDQYGLLMRLREHCLDRTCLPHRDSTVRYLRSKALFHHRRVQEHLYELLNDLQLSLMARGQAISVLSTAPTSPADYFALSNWPDFEGVLRECGVDASACDEGRVLVEAHKAGFSNNLFAEFQRRLSFVAQELELAIDRTAQAMQGAPNPPDEAADSPG